MAPPVLIVTLPPLRPARVRPSLGVLPLALILVVRSVPVVVMLILPPLPLAPPSLNSAPRVVAVAAVALLLTIMRPASDAAVVPTDDAC